MRIDLIIDGDVYIAEPYLGQTECIECALGKICDDIYIQPCQMYQSKVIFRIRQDANSILYEMPEMPCVGDIIKITRKFGGNVALEKGDLVKVVDVSCKDDHIFLEVKKAGAVCKKRISSKKFQWIIIKN